MTLKSKNTIDELIAEDVERSKPKEKCVHELPNDFFAKSKYGQNIGPSIGDLDKNLSMKSVDFKVIKEEKLKQIVGNFNRIPFQSKGKPYV
jgi:hypothetical protein